MCVPPDTRGDEMDEKIEAVRKENLGMIRSLLLLEVEQKGFNFLDDLIEKLFQEQRFVRSRSFQFVLKSYDKFIGHKGESNQNRTFDFYRHTWLAF